MHETETLYQTGDTIKDILDKIQRNDIVLPGIQRDFVWRSEQIYRLFDSIMQGYPFGTFLYWRVEPKNSHKFNFYDFVLNYHEKDNPHCPRLSPIYDRQLTAVLDGQQRLTALNIGLRGSISRKLPRLWWNNPYAFPKRLLYLDLLWKPDQDDDEERLKYRFSFLTDEQVDKADEKVCWFPVREVLSLSNPGPAISAWLNERLPQEQVTQAHEVLYELYQVVHSKEIVASYEEGSQELDKVLQIFIRMNDGGTPLSHSDLLLSTAVAQWTKHDAKEEINTFVNELNNIGSGFDFSKDLVLKAGLMLSDIGSIGFRVENFNRDNMARFEDNWNDIKRALMLTVQLISSFGFSRQNLTAHNAILPIAYYFYRRNLGEAYLDHTQFKTDRQAIRKWLIRSLLKSGIWGRAPDSLLTALRQVIRQDANDYFPFGQIYKEMAGRGRSLVFGDEEIENLADMRYGDVLTFALLSLLFTFADLRNNFHIDHVFPRSKFTKTRLETAGVPEDEIDDFIDRRDSLANLQLLQGPQNIEKNAEMPAQWLARTHPDTVRRREYQERHLLGEVPDSITEFSTFCDERRERLKERIKQLLGSQALQHSSSLNVPQLGS